MRIWQRPREPRESCDDDGASLLRWRAAGVAAGSRDDLDASLVTAIAAAIRGVLREFEAFRSHARPAGDMGSHSLGQQ